jgi:hypothetical protein
MTVRFQADADLNAEIVAGVLRREPSIDFQTADKASLHRVPDPECCARLLGVHCTTGSQQGRGAVFRTPVSVGLY